MQRIRTIKPEFFKHDDLFQAEQDFGLPLRLAFAGLWTCCDREGRFKWKPRQLKIDVLPYDDIDFSRVLDALATRGFILKYTSAGEVYGCVSSFSSHQAINNKESGSVLPDPADCEPVEVADRQSNQEVIANDSTRNPRVTDASITPLDPTRGEGKGREGKGTGKEGNILQAAPRPAADKVANPLNLKTWQAYSNAYFDRYGTEPVRNQKVNGQIANLVKRLGEDSPHVAAFYLTHNLAWYVQHSHSADGLLKDAEALRTQWATNKTVTQHQARSADKFGDLGHKINAAFTTDEVY